jgi:xanthine/CO dehydrogenase XdhC/CoxF family maturation factor
VEKNRITTIEGLAPNAGHPLRQAWQFLGLLGPSHRKGRLLQSLGSDASRISNRVFGPVGLDIGAETPEEIALSIMAGIHADAVDALHYVQRIL